MIGRSLTCRTPGSSKLVGGQIIHLKQTQLWAGGAPESHRRLPAHLSLWIFFAAFILINITDAAFCQSGFEEGEFVTFADARDVRCGDLTPREVVFATSGGVWRLDRETGEPLEPWLTGVGRDRAVNLSGGRAILWHEVSGSIWLATTSGIYYYRWGVRLWYKLEGAPGGDVSAIGEKRDSLFIYQRGRIGAIDPFAFRFLGWLKRDSADIRWTGSLNKQPTEYPSYGLDDYSYRYERRDGRIVDRDFREYKPSYTFLDEEYRRRYICYPGLGIGSVDERSGNLSLRQTGPAGDDVRAIALDDDGVIWIGGDNDGDFDGVNRFDRTTLVWKRFSKREINGIESTSISDILVSASTVYAASAAGLLTFDQRMNRWKTFGRLEGGPGDAIRALAIAGGWIVIGGDGGASRMLLASGPFAKLDNPMLKDIRASQATVDGDTIWLSGLQGVYRGVPDGKWELLTGDRTIGAEPARSIAVSPELVCIGGQSGVRIYNRKSGDWNAIQAATYLNGGQTLSLAVADSLIWIGTDRGLFRYNRKQGAFLNFGQNEGLPSARIQRIVVENDSLWLGSPRGLVRFIWNRPNRDID